MQYFVTFIKEFGNFHAKIKGELEWVVYEFINKEAAIEQAKILNELPTINLSTEHFRVYEHDSKFKRFIKNKSKLIYPSFENPLFH